MKKLHINLIAIFMLISLFSVGFAAWQIMNLEVKDEQQGTIIVEQAKEFDTYVDLTNTTKLMYNKKGFVGYPEKYNYIGFDMIVDLYEIKTNIPAANKVQLTLSLELTGEYTYMVEDKDVFGYITPEIYSIFGEQKVECEEYYVEWHSYQITESKDYIPGFYQIHLLFDIPQEVTKDSTCEYYVTFNFESLEGSGWFTDESSAFADQENQIFKVITDLSVLG